MRRLALSLALMAGIACSVAVSAQPARSAAEARNTPWSSLTPAQRAALQPLERDWSRIDPLGKQKWLEIAARFPRMPADERARMQERMTEWSRMTPQQRGQARLRFQEARQLAPQERQARWQAYQALPSERKEELARLAAPKPRGRASDVDGAPKSNVVPNPTHSGTPKTVAPTIVQARPGATTTLVTRRPVQPPHQHTGLPKIAATPSFVDSSTLLPKRGPQGAATRPSPSSESGRGR